MINRAANYSYVCGAKKQQEKKVGNKMRIENIIVGDVVVVYDEYAHDYLEHIIKVESIVHDVEYVTDSNPEGIVCYGEDLTHDEYGDDYITIVTEANLIGKLKKTEYTVA